MEGSTKRPNAPILARMNAFGRLYYRGAGDSAMRRYNSLSLSWRRRTLGRRTNYYFWLVLTLGLFAALEFTSSKWRLGEGI